jgi:hypothetical protein
MARYNTAPQTLTLTGATVLTYAFTGGIISLTGTAGYAVTLASPVFFPGARQTFYNATSGSITLTASAGNFKGNGVTLGVSITIPTNSTYIITSDGADYVLTSAFAGQTIFELPITTRNTLTASSTVNLTPANANVTISPTGSGTVAISPAGLLSIQPGGNVTISPTGTSTLTLNTAGGALTVGSASVPAVIGGNLTATAANATVTLSPTGASGNVSIIPGNNVTITATNVLALSSTVTGSLNNVSVGNVTAAPGRFTTLTAANATTLTAGTASTGTGSGTLVITGGLGVSGRINAANVDAIIGANTAAAGSFTTLSSNAATTFTQNAASTNTTSGTLVVTGGVGVSGAIYAGSIQNTPIGNASANSGAFSTLSANAQVTFTAGTASTGTGSGTIVVTGGVGISGNINAGGIQNTPIGSATASSGLFTTLGVSSTVTLSPANTTVTISPSGTGTVAISPAGALTINPSTAGTINNMSIGASTRSTGAFTTLTSNAATTFTQNAGSTNTSSGTLVVTGGVGISERLYAGSIQNTPIGSAERNSGAFTTLTSNSTTTFTQNASSTGTTSGTVVVTGGVGISENLWVGGVINATNGTSGIIGYTNVTSSQGLADSDRRYIVSNGGAITLTLPATNTDGRTIVFVDGNNFGAFNVTIARNGRLIGGLAEDLVLNLQNSKVELVYRGGDWKQFFA